MSDWMNWKEPEYWADILDRAERRSDASGTYVVLPDDIVKQMASDLRGARDYFADIYDDRDER